MVSIDSFRAADYAVLGTAGGVTLTAGLAALYALPWRCCRWQRFEPFNTFWKGKIVLELILGFWAALQILRLALLWGPDSIVAPDSVTNWTSDGWLCRIYLTAALGIAAPLSAWLFLFLLAAGKTETETSTLSLANKYYNTTVTTATATQQQMAYDSSNRSYSPQIMLPNRENPSGDGGGRTGRNSFSSSNGAGAGAHSHHHHHHWRVGRAFFFALLCTFPIALLQTAAAWVSQWVDYQGIEIEREPRTLIGYFLAVFWYGTPTQCNSTNSTTSQNCTLCTFPAASAIIHLLWTILFLFCLWTTAARISAAALNRALQKRLRVLVTLYTTFAGIGCACLGVSVVEGPFSWINQGVWLGYVATVAATILLLSWEVVVVPVHSSHVAARRALEWQDGDSSGQLTYAQAVVASPDFPPYSYPYPSTFQHQHQQQQQLGQQQSGQGQQEEQRRQQMGMFTLSSNASSVRDGDVNGNEDASYNNGLSGGGSGNISLNGFEASAPPPFPALPPVPYCQVELATHPPTSATNRKSRSRLFARTSTRASSRVDSEDGGGGGDDATLISARDVLADTINNTSNDGSVSGGLQGISNPYMTPQQRQQQQRQQQGYSYSRAESPSGGGGGGGGSMIPALYNRYYSNGGGSGYISSGGGQGPQQQQQQFGLYRPGSAASSTAGSVGSGVGGILSGSQGRSSWPLSPPSPRTSTSTGSGAPSIAALQLASYYQPHWQQQQQQRGASAGMNSRPSTASSSAPASTLSPVLHAYGSAGGRSSQPYYSGTGGGGAGGGIGLGLFGLHGLGGGGSGRYYHNPSSSFGRAQEAAIGTPSSSGTATPTPQSTQKMLPPPPWR